MTTESNLFINDATVNGIDYGPSLSIDMTVETVNGLATIDLTDPNKPNGLFFPTGYRNHFASVDKNDNAPDEVTAYRLESIEWDTTYPNIPRSLTVKVFKSDDPTQVCTDGTKVNIWVHGY